MTDTPRPRSGCLPYALGAAALLALLGAGGAYLWHRHTAEVQAQHEAEAREAFAPAEQQLDQAIAQAAAEPVDIDKTIRAIHEIDLALQNTATLGDYLQFVARQDYRGVAPEVLQARRDLLGILFKLYAKQTEAEDQEQMWQVASQTLLQAASLVSAQVSVDGAASGANVSLDRAQAQALLRQIEAERAARASPQRDIHGLEDELLQELIATSASYHTWVERWDRLCTVRDRAYLAASAGDWAAAHAAANQAIEVAPMEREAHLLAAFAAIEGDLVVPEDQDVPEMLQRYIDEHPNATAPALLLLGVWQARHGETAQARLNLEQAAATYPRQAQGLQDLLDPYQSRAWLRKSREGNYILRLYKATMSGAGYFSPDLQLARLQFDAGDAEAGRRKVLDHFQRRRSQGEWSFILDDVAFAETFLGAEFQAMLPEAAYLDLVAKPALLGDKLNLAVKNRSDRTLHNATLLLALHMTDMARGDYEVIRAGDTQPSVLAHDTTPFGDVAVDVKVMGENKGVGDIVESRSILISDEAVAWVDSEPYKIAEGEEFRRARGQGTAALPPALAPALATLPQRATLDWASELGKDVVRVKLPRELAALSPTFRLQVGDQLLSPKVDRLDEDGIALEFSMLNLGVDELLGNKEGRPELGLLVSGPDLALDLRWGSTGGDSYTLLSTGAR